MLWSKAWFLGKELLEAQCWEAVCQLCCVSCLDFSGQTTALWFSVVVLLSWSSRCISPRSMARKEEVASDSSFSHCISLWIDCAGFSEHSKLPNTMPSFVHRSYRTRCNLPMRIAQHLYPLTHCRLWEQTGIRGLRTQQHGRSAFPLSHNGIVYSIGQDGPIRCNRRMTGQSGGH